MSTVAAGITLKTLLPYLVGGGIAYNAYSNHNARNNMLAQTQNMSPEDVLNLQGLMAAPAHSYLDMMMPEQASALVASDFGRNVKGLKKREIKDIQNVLNLLELRNRGQQQMSPEDVFLLENAPQLYSSQPLDLQRSILPFETLPEFTSPAQNADNRARAEQILGNELNNIFNIRR